jgi:dTDP-4-amino-4,6-dideoxygalactose transaminase
MVPFLDLKAQYAEIKDEVNAAVMGVIESCQFVLGDEVKAFEDDFAVYCQSDHCVALNSGTSALHLALLALNIGPGDEVITVSSTFIATVAAIRYVGATPVFVDVDKASWTMDANLIEAAITPKTKVIMPVHLHGRVADMGAICAIAEKCGLQIIEDAAQAHGAQHNEKRAGSFGAIGCFSYYPGKNLGAYGEGGAAVTNDATLAHKMRVLRDWGQEEKHHHAIQGYNARMDGIQGAVLRVKLRYLDKWVEARRAHATLYDELLLDIDCTVPTATNDRHVYHIYSVLVDERDRVQKALGNSGIGTNIHYPIPAHLQGAHTNLGYKNGDLPVTEKLGSIFLSLPMFAELSDDQISETVDGLRKAING